MTLLMEYVSIYVHVSSVFEGEGSFLFTNLCWWYGHMLHCIDSLCQAQVVMLGRSKLHQHKVDPCVQLISS